MFIYGVHLVPSRQTLLETTKTRKYDDEKKRNHDGEMSKVWLWKQDIISSILPSWFRFFFRLFIIEPSTFHHRNFELSLFRVVHFLMALTRHVFITLTLILNFLFFMLCTCEEETYINMIVGSTHVRMMSHHNGELYSDNFTVKL